MKSRYSYFMHWLCDTKQCKSLYLIINKVNGYIDESNGNKYLIQAPTDESKDILRKYEELWRKIRELIRSTSNNSDNCDEKLNQN